MDSIINKLANNNETAYFYGVFNNCFKIDSIIFEAIEDPDDGYRSYLDSVVLKDEPDLVRHFFKKPLAKVRLDYISEESNGGLDGDMLRENLEYLTDLWKELRECPEDDEETKMSVKEEIASREALIEDIESTEPCHLFRLVDVETGHVWLKFGTRNTDDYYPYFVFSYKPNKNRKDFVSVEPGYKTIVDRIPHEFI